MERWARRRRSPTRGPPERSRETKACFSPPGSTTINKYGQGDFYDMIIWTWSSNVELNICAIYAAFTRDGWLPDSGGPAVGSAAPLKLYCVRLILTANCQL